MIDLAPGTRMAEWLEQAWLERYLARQLGPAEADWFEAYMLDKAHLLDALDADSDLRDGLHARSPSEELPVLSAAATSSIPVPPEVRPDGVLSERARATAGRPHARRSESDAHMRSSAASSPSWTRITSVAAGLLVALTAGWFAGTRQGSHDAPDLMASPTRIRFDQSRGATDAPLVENGGAALPFVVVEVAVPPNATRVLLHVEGSRDATLVPNAEGIVTFVARRDKLASLSASVEIETSGGDHSSRRLEFPGRLP